MNDITFWQNLWFFMMLLVLFFYTILDGFDLGIGLVLPFYKKKEDRNAIINSIYPFWDGNELWLIIGTAVLFAISPISFSVLLGAFYLGFMFIFFAFTLRAASFEFLYHDIGSRTKIWQLLFFGATLACTISGMFTLGNILHGIPLNTNKEFIGSFFTLLRPYSAITGFLGISIIIVHGLSYIIMKSEGELKDRSIKLLKKFLVFQLILSIIFIFSSVVFVPESNKRFLFYLGSIIMVGGVLYLFYSLRFSFERFIFFISSVCIAGFWITVGSLLFPNIIKASNDPLLSITIYNGSSSLLTLKYMAFFSIIGFTIVLGYAIFIYRVFKGKIK